MSGDLWPVPALMADLVALPVRIKPDWQGFAARAVGALLWLGELFRVRAATRAMDEFVQVIGGTIYLTRGSGDRYRSNTMRPGLATHESVHDWQQRTRGKVRYVLGYYLSKKYRRNAEAMAYAVEVAMGVTTLFGAAKSASDPIYAMGWGHGDAAVLIQAYVAKWKTDSDVAKS